MTSQLTTTSHHKSQSNSAKMRCHLDRPPLRLVGLTMNQHRLARLLTRRGTTLTAAATALAMSKMEEA